MTKVNTTGSTGGGTGSGSGSGSGCSLVNGGPPGVGNGTVVNNCNSINVLLNQ